MTTTMTVARGALAWLNRQSAPLLRLGRLIAEIGDRAPGEADVADLRASLYGLHAILRLHTDQEEKAYLSLGDTEDDKLISGPSN